MNPSSFGSFLLHWSYAHICGPSIFLYWRCYNRFLSTRWRSGIAAPGQKNGTIISPRNMLDFEIFFRSFGCLFQQYARWHCPDAKLPSSSPSIKSRHPKLSLKVKDCLMRYSKVTFDLRTTKYIADYTHRGHRFLDEIIFFRLRVV